MNSVKVQFSLKDPRNRKIITKLEKQVHILGISEVCKSEDNLLIEVYCSKETVTEILEIINESNNTEGTSIREIDKNIDWEGFAKKLNKAVIIDDFYFCAPWDNTILDNKKRVVISPGQAFGTGSHESTRISVLQIQAYLKKKKAKNMLDLGTGTGIVSFVANMMGQNNIYAIDNDFEALANAIENSKLNQGGNEINFQHKGVFSIIDQFELVSVNMFAEELIKIRGDLERISHKDSTILVSGVEKDKEKWIYRHFEKTFSVQLREEISGWVGLSLIKK